MSHLYKRGGRKTWYIKYYEDGRPKYRSLKTASKKRALAMQREIDRRLDAGILAVSEKTSDADMDTFWERYLQWAQGHKRPSTIAVESAHWEQFVKQTRIRYLSDITKAKIERFKQARLKTVSPRTINNALNALQALINHATNLGLYPGGMCDHSSLRCAASYNRSLTSQKLVWVAWDEVRTTYGLLNCERIS